MEFEEEPQARIDKERVSISVVQHQGRFRRAIPCMPMALAGLCCFCNVFVPGLGTFISALSVLCCADPRTETMWGSCLTNLVAAILQFILFPVVIGFIWSVIWGVLFIQIAHETARDKRIAERQALQKAAEL